MDAKDERHAYHCRYHAVQLANTYKLTHISLILICLEGLSVVSDQACYATSNMTFSWINLTFFKHIRTQMC